MKHYSVLSILSLLLLLSCKEHQEKSLAGSENIPEEPVNISRTLAGQQEKFSELPPLAKYINQLVFWEDEQFVASSEKLNLNNHLVVFTEESETQLDKFSSKFAQFSGGWSGTGSALEWVSTYTMLKDGINPIVLVTRASTKLFRVDYETYIEERKELENDLANVGVDEDKILAIADKMTAREMMGYPISLKNETVNHQLSFWVWQKKEDQWENISTHAFPDNMAENLEQHFPFFTADAEIGPEFPEGLYLSEKSYSRPALMANKANWLTWFGVKKLSDLNLNLEMDGDDILLRCSPNKVIRWQWDGSNYSLKNLPGKVEWINTPCTKIDLQKGGDFLFKGKIGKNSAIEMQANIKTKGGKTLISGEYWYSNQTTIKFPIEGTLYPEADKALSFHRIKSGKKRESFNAYFTNCRFEGYWQHLGNMDIDQFYLELVQ